MKREPYLMDATPILPKVLRLTVRVEKDEPDLFKMQRVIPAPRFKIMFELARLFMGYEIQSWTVGMWASYYGDDERFRRELLANKYRDSVGLSSEVHLWDEYPGPVSKELEDPHGIIAWLFADMDINEFYNDQKLLNDQPVRLPPSH